MAEIHRRLSIDERIPDIVRAKFARAQILYLLGWVDRDVLKIVRDHCTGRVIDMFATFIEPLEQEFGVKSNHRVGRFSDVARSQAVVEHAGSINDAALSAIAAAMTKKYGRQVRATAKKNDALLAGLRVRVGDDTYESSVAGQLAALGAAV